MSLQSKVKLPEARRMNRSAMTRPMTVTSINAREYLDWGLAALFVAAVMFALTVNLESTPPLGWDEGWTLTTAQNWVEVGAYSMMLDGQRVVPILAAAPPTTIPVALAFRLLGVGVWQGRLVGAAFLIGASALVFYLGLRLYNRKVAIACLFALFLMSPHLEMNPIYNARQALAEVPMLFYLLAGYTFFLLAVRRHLVFLLFAMMSWGISIVSKAQVVPFWVISLIIPLLIQVFQRRWRLAGLLGIALVGSLYISRLVVELESNWLFSTSGAGRTITGLYDVTALVLNFDVRKDALAFALILGLPTILGLAHAAWEMFKQLKSPERGIEGALLRSMLLTLSGSWLAWFILLSVGWVRYLFPATFLGSIFVGAFLHDLTAGINWRETTRRAASALKYLRFDRASVGAIVVILLLALYPQMTLQQLYRLYSQVADTSSQQVTDFLNSGTAPAALVESYDSQLFFRLNRRYHYPPEQSNVGYIRMVDLGEDSPIEYDALAANPDYIVIGRMSRSSHMYDSVLASGAFRLFRDDQVFQIYQRVR